MAPPASRVYRSPALGARNSMTAGDQPSLNAVTVHEWMIARFCMGGKLLIATMTRLISPRRMTLLKLSMSCANSIFEDNLKRMSNKKSFFRRSCHSCVCRKTFCIVVYHLQAFSCLRLLNIRKTVLLVSIMSLFQIIFSLDFQKLYQSR